MESKTIEAVKKALDNPQYKYRTIRGIAKEINVASKQVEEAPGFKLDNVVRSSYKNQFGDQLFTNRSKLHDTSFFGRLRATLVNRVD